MRKLLFAICFFVSLSANSQALFSDSVKVGPNSWDWRPGLSSLPLGYSTDTAHYALLLFFHGIGEASSSRNDALLRRTGLPNLIDLGLVPQAVNPVDGKTYKFIVVCPQHGYSSWGADGTPIQFKYMLDELISRYRIDTSRIYLEGLSGGAQSCVEAVTWDTTFAKRIASIFPISLTGLGLNQPRATDSVPAIGKHYNVPSWTVVGSADTSINGVNPYQISLTYNNSYNSLTPSPLGVRTVIAGGTHSASTWNVAADTGYRMNNGMNSLEWMLSNKRTFAAGGTPPSNPPLPSPPNDTFKKVTIKIVLSTAPNPGTKVTVADLKYNKQGHYDFTQDDRGTGALLASIVYSGGTYNGVNYSGLTFTDGANVRGRNIYYTGSVATNAWANADTLTDFSGMGATYMNWLQMDTLLRRGWSILDHGAFHGISQPGAVNLGFNTLMNSAANRNYTFRKLSALDDPYVMRYGVVPSADTGYHSVWEQEGYVGGISQNAFDNYPAEPSADWANNGIGIVTNYKNDNRYHVQARRFKDFNAADFWADYKPAFDALFAQSSATVKTTLGYGIHMFNIDSFNKAMTYFQTNAGDRMWVCGQQEFYEYFQTAQQTGIYQSIVGDTLTVILDQSHLPSDVRWRDMSFLLNSNATISSVTVIGALDYSYNTTTGLINIYKMKTQGFSAPAYYNNTGFVSGKLPLTGNNIFIDNNYATSPDSLIDGNTASQYHARPYDGAMIYSPYDVTFRLSDYGITVDSVRVYASGITGFSTSVILTRNDNENEVNLGTFTSGSGWIKFAVPSGKFVASRLILRSNSTGGFGNEVEVYGSYLPYIEQVYAKRNVPLKNMLGVNAHWWNFVENTNDSTTALNLNKIAGFDSLRLQTLRNYGNADQYQDSTGAKWAFNPVTQGWFEELFMRRLKQDNPSLIRWSVLQGQSLANAKSWNVEDSSYQMRGKVVSYSDTQGWGVLTVSVTSATGSGQWKNWFVDPITGTASKQTSNSWITIPTTFPSNQTFVVGAAVPYAVGDSIRISGKHISTLNFNYANNSDAGRNTLSTWDSVGTYAYRWAARKGKNPNVSSFLPYTNSGSPWLNNTNVLATNTSEWTEVMNEPNAWWGDRDNYLNGSALGAAWSKIYDNNKVASTSIGSRNADTGMLVSTSGLAISTVDLNESADFWAKKNRGSRPKIDVPTQPNTWRAKTFGWVDNPYDVIQFHNYSYSGGHAQFDAGGTKSGLPPEIGVALDAVDKFVLFRNKYAPWAKVDVGEFGYDVNQGSPMNATTIGSYDSAAIAGIWLIRTLLTYNAHGVDYAQAYRLYQDNLGDNFSDATQFGTMSLLREDATTHAISLRKSGRYFAELSEFGDYVFDSTLREDSIRVYRFKKDTNYLYAIWSVENWTNQAQDGSQKAVFANRTGTFNLPIANGTITVRQLQDVGTTMSSSSATVTGNSYPVSYDLKPTFIQTAAANMVTNAGRFIYRRGSRIIVKQF